MKNQLEHITHSHKYYELFIVNMLQRSPHIHMDYELCILLEGSLTITINQTNFFAERGDIWLINPFQCHSFSNGNPGMILCLQISPGFFSDHFPQIRQLFFSFKKLKYNDFGYQTLCQQLMWLGLNSFSLAPLYELRCASLINYIFHLLLDVFPWTMIPEEELNSQKLVASRLQTIQAFIEENYREKLLLSDIASHMNLSLYYLSHFFKENFGMSFQNYLANYRCEQARHLLVNTSLPLFDISTSCGFSDPKYFNAHFRQLFGYTPQQYRTSFYQSQNVQKRQTMLTTQHFLSTQTSYMILNKYIKENNIKL